MKKVRRDAFLYYDPHENSPEEEFAQCATCRMFVPEEFLGGRLKGARCVAFGSAPEVVAEASCGVYLIWPSGKPDAETMRNHGAELAAGMFGSVTPEEAGYVDRPVRCENCNFFEEPRSACNFFKVLNDRLPSTFDLNVKVDPRGCCNANTAIPKN